MQPSLTFFALVLLVACARNPEREDAAANRAMIADVEWELVSLGEQGDPVGAGGRRPTLRLTAAESRAGGFGGCNRWSAPYTTAGDSLAFGGAVATKMACAEGMRVESEFFGVLEATRRFQATDSTLTLLSAGAPLAVFRRGSP